MIESVRWAEEVSKALTQLVRLVFAPQMPPSTYCPFFVLEHDEYNIQIVSSCKVYKIIINCAATLHYLVMTTNCFRLLPVFLLPIFELSFVDGIREGPRR